MKIYTQGTYDLFHAGHVNLLKRCRKISDFVVVALLTDEAIKEYRGKLPIISYENRLAVLKSCIYVDEVIPSDPKNTRDEIKGVNPDFIVLGTDWAIKDIYKQYKCDKKWLDQYLLFFPYTDGISSTSIKKKIYDQF